VFLGIDVGLKLFFIAHWKWWWDPFESIVLLRSESPSGKFTKIHVVAANNNRDHKPRSLYYCLFVPHMYECCSSCTSRWWWIAHSTTRQ